MVKTKEARKMTKRILALLLAVMVGIGSVKTGVCAQTFSEETEASMAAETAGVDALVDETAEPGGWDGTTMEDVYEGKNFRVSFTLADHWEGGYNAGIKIENTGDTIIENWSLGMDYSGEISNIWNAVVSTHAENHYVIKMPGGIRTLQLVRAWNLALAGRRTFRGFRRGMSCPGNCLM